MYFRQELGERGHDGRSGQPVVALAAVRAKATGHVEACFLRHRFALPNDRGVEVNRRHGVFGHNCCCLCVELDNDLHIGFGRIIASEVEVPNMLVNLV